MTKTNTLIPVARPQLPELSEYVRLLEKIWDSRILSNFSTYALELESIAQRYLRSWHVLCCSSGEAGLTMVLGALDLPHGAPCYMPTFTFNSTINAALWNRLRPVFVDIDLQTLTMSPSSLADAMSKARVRGVIVATHTLAILVTSVPWKTWQRQAGNF